MILVILKLLNLFFVSKKYNHSLNKRAFTEFRLSLMFITRFQKNQQQYFNIFGDFTDLQNLMLA